MFDAILAKLSALESKIEKLLAALGCEDSDSPAEEPVVSNASTPAPEAAAPVTDPTPAADAQPAVADPAIQPAPASDPAPAPADSAPAASQPDAAPATLTADPKPA